MHVLHWSILQYDGTFVFLSATAPDLVQWSKMASKSSILRLTVAETERMVLKMQGTPWYKLYNMYCYINCRFWEALMKLDQALQLTPLDEKIYEMKAQVNIVETMFLYHDTIW